MKVMMEVWLTLPRTRPELNEKKAVWPDNISHPSALEASEPPTADKTAGAAGLYCHKSCH